MFSSNKYTVKTFKITSSLIQIKIIGFISRITLVMPISAVIIQ
jgi:hypothetical protein